MDGRVGAQLQSTGPWLNDPRVECADEAMARGDVQQARNLLELAARDNKDASILLRLATVRAAGRDLPGAVTCAAAAVELAPDDLLACLLLGSLREATGALHAAQRAYRAACACPPLDVDFQPGAARQLERAKTVSAAAQRWREKLLRWDSRGSGLEPAGRMDGFRRNILANMESGPLQQPLFMVPGIQGRTYFEPTGFAGLGQLQAHCHQIRDEFLNLAQGKIGRLKSSLAGLHGHQGGGGQSGRWSMIPLIRNGRVVAEFAAECPRTMEAAAALELPRLSLISPSLYFSVLEPGGHIHTHSGITNARVIAHLPLVVPDGCAIRVGGEVRRWAEGKALVFDDVTPHEAWNRSDRTRVVLIADLWRPELSQKERAVVAELMDCPDR
jgi:aspartate beta-hydroxylase